jgi:hypothetical protein
MTMQTETTMTSEKLVTWCKPVQGRIWREYRSRCGRFVIECVPRDGKYGSTTKHDYLLKWTTPAGRDTCRGFDTLGEAKFKAEMIADKRTKLTT